ncbi:MAG: 1,4-alpha-glucan branching protein GlgB [Deltaproteobacteria bacterium]|nr:1,4-alpha-glucan branching protein GlgB [Deltaproteobacteria bacterium]MDQ3301037.1 1,4-alpha-glucan branching protein GlgB [Myxococcota bacterium]
MTSLLTADDLFLFNQGTQYQLYRKLGAHLVDGGTYFAVWAPNAQAVSVIGDWNGWHAGGNALSARESSGIWEGVVRGIGHGSRYKYAISGPDGITREKADPFAARAEHPPATASIVWQSQHPWGDASWMKTRGARAARTAPMSIYEVHLGSWRRNHNEVLGYRQLGEQLGEHCTNLGFTHVELMPVMEHPFYGSWGYQVTGYFAPTTRYGAPDDFMAMVDHLHQRNIGVIVDWVPAHFPTDAHGLGVFDGTHLFEHADPRRGFHPDWTSFIFNYGRHEVKSFLISSAMSWLDRYHIDGLRVDGVASMLYKDYSRKPGEWVPNEDGSNHDREAIVFLQDFNRAVYTAFPDIQTIAEESTAWGGVSKPPEHGGLGFGYKWDLGWMHDTLSYLAREPVYRKFHHSQLTFRAIYANTENYCMPLSHDEVVHGKGSLIAKIPGDPWQKYATLRLLYGYQWTLPGKKLLFMGGELGVWGEWNHDAELDWAIGMHPSHAGIARWLGDLNAAYRKYPALHRGDCEPWGFKWIVGDDADASVLAFARYDEHEKNPIVIAANFTPVPREGYRIGVPRGGHWREILNSDAEVYGGAGLGNRGGMNAEHHGSHGFEHSLVCTVPPLAVVVFAAEG